MQLTQLQEEVLVGTLLGDAHLEVNGRNCRLQIQHGRNQRTYVDWKYEIFNPWVKSPPREVGVNDYRFRTITSEVLTKYHRIFYPDGRTKIVPPNIRSLLVKPISLAVLYMDDGKRRPDCRGVYLDTLSFGIKGQELLIKCLEANFGFQDLRLHWNGDGYHIYFPAKNANSFNKLLSLYIIDSMKYKLPLAP